MIEQTEIMTFSPRDSVRGLIVITNSPVDFQQVKEEFKCIIATKNVEY